MLRNIFLTALLLVTVASCSPAPAAPALRVEAAWARPTAAGNIQGGEQMPGMSMGGGMTSAVYLVIYNDGGQADALTGVSSDAGRASLHQTLIQEGVASMVPVDRLEIPARGQVELKPGSYHIMLEDLMSPLNPGSTVQLTLRFEKSPAVTLSVPVRPIQ